MTTPQTLKEARELAAQNGILLTEKEEQYIQAQQQQERARLVATTPAAAPDMATRFNRFYPRLLQSIISLGETVLTFAQTVIVSLGVPVVLVLLLIVEHQRVVHGIGLFEADLGLASFAAAALVFSNLVLEFQIHHIEHKQGYAEERGRRWSLRIWAHNALYTLGIGKTWTAQYLSSAARYKSILRLVTFTILALALMGSMRDVIDQQSGAWYEALIAIVSESSLLLLLTWIGGLLFAAFAVLTAQVLSQYVALRCVEIISAMSTAQTEAIDPFAADVDQAGALALYSIITAKQSAKAEKAAKASANKPHVSVLPEQTPVEAVVIEQRPLATEDAHEKIARTGVLVNMPMIAQPQESVSAASENGNGHHG